MSTEPCQDPVALLWVWCCKRLGHGLHGAEYLAHQSISTRLFHKQCGTGWNLPHSMDHEWFLQFRHIHPYTWLQYIVFLRVQAAHGPHIHHHLIYFCRAVGSQPSDYNPDLGSMCGHQNRSSRATLWHRLIVSQCEIAKKCLRLIFTTIPLHDFTNWICSSKEVRVVFLRYGQ